MSVIDRSSFHFTVEDFLIVTWAVPAERVRPLVPARLELDTIAGPDGAPRALLSTVSFQNRRFHWPGAPGLGIDFPQMNFRTYVRHPVSPAVYFFAAYLGHPLIWLGQRLLAANVYRARIQRTVERAGLGYRSYRVTARGPHGTTRLAVRDGTQPPPPTPPFASGSELALFITQRLLGYGPRVDGRLDQVEVAHRPLELLAGTWVGGDQAVWQKLGLLTPAEAARPYAVLLSARGQFRAPVPDLRRFGRPR